MRSTKLSKPRAEQSFSPTLTGRSIARAASWSWTGNIVSQIAWFGSLIILGALLPPRSFGTVAIGVVIANAAMLVQDAGSRGSIIVARQLTRSHVVRTVMINVIGGLAFALVGGLLAGPVIHHLAAGGNATVVRILIASVVVRSVAIAPMAVLQRTMQFKLQSAVTATSTFIAGFASVAAALLGAGVWSLVIRQLVAAVLLPLLAWVAASAAIRSDLAREPRGRGPEKRRGAHWFFLLAATDFLGLSMDTIIVGHTRGAAQLGLYSLAFTLAFAPLTSFAWQIGKVLFPAAAAAPDLETIVRRMLRSLRLAAAVLLPLLPPALVLAPVLLPGILGPEWKAMVVPFQILLVVGVGHALTIMIGDSLAGAGEIAFRARLHLVWCIGMAAALVVLVHLDGIQGAAFAHLVLFVPFAAAYLVWGTRRLGTRAEAVFSALRGVVRAVIAQLGVTVVCVLGFERIGIAQSAAATAGAALGVVLVAALLVRFEGPLVREFREFVNAVVSRGP